MACENCESGVTPTRSAYATSIPQSHKLPHTHTHTLSTCKQVPWHHRDPTPIHSTHAPQQAARGQGICQRCYANSALTLRASVGECSQSLPSQTGREATPSSACLFCAIFVPLRHKQPSGICQIWYATTVLTLGAGPGSVASTHRSDRQVSNTPHLPVSFRQHQRPFLPTSSSHHPNAPRALHLSLQ